MKRLFKSPTEQPDGSSSPAAGGPSTTARTIARDPRTGEPRLPALNSVDPFHTGHHFTSPPAPTRRASEAITSRTTASTFLSPINTLTSATLPGYVSTSSPIAIPARAPIPSYDDATSPTSPSSFSGYISSQAGSSSLEPVGSLRTEASQLVRDHFAFAPSSFRETVFEDEEGGEREDDDPFSPRVRRPAPPPNLIPLGSRRNTMPHLYRPPSPPDSDDSGPAIEMDSTQVILDLPPPAELPPGYSAHLAEDELRLISTVHLDQNHPAASFFSQMTSNALSPLQANSGLPGGSGSGPTEQSTGSKKLKLTLTTGAERTNISGSGPMFIRMNRGGKIEGRLELGKVDHVTGLDVAILGYVNTSYYVRGQYTLIDTLPLARRQTFIWPAKAPIDGFSYAPTSATSSASASTATTTAPPSSTTPVTTVPIAPSTSNDSSPTSPRNISAVLDSSSTPSTFSNRPTTTATNGQPETADSAYEPPPVPDDEYTYANANPQTVTVGKDTFLAPDQTFHFSIQMPTAHCRLANTELPPSTQIFQVGMQAGIEYVLRVKMSRKGWRISETFGVPIIYEPRCFVTPRRLRILTTNDALNPGWRTIKLNGGKPVKSTEGSDPIPDSPGVEVSLLLPSPPILFVPDGGAPPPIPFHLHFHSSAILPLMSFSDPKECRFIVRFMRVATMMIGCEKEIRRMEIPSVVELWQEGGPHLIMDEERDATRPSKKPTTSGAPTGSTPSERKRSFSDRRPSFLKRRSSSSAPPQDTESALARAVSNVPTEAVIPEEPTRPETPSILAPLSIGATDVHILGQLTLKLPSHGPAHVRNMIQSFFTPEVGISYLVEVGLQPKNGAVKEAFTHVWGGGIIEVVLGHRGRR